MNRVFLVLESHTAVTAEDVLTLLHVGQLPRQPAMQSVVMRACKRKLCQHSTRTRCSSSSILYNAELTKVSEWVYSTGRVPLSTFRPRPPAQ